MKEAERICWVVDLGLIPYGPACGLQRQIVEARKARTIPDVLLFCEHPHVITLGRNGKQANLRAGNHLLSQLQVAFHATDRGGDITYHGPGQVVGYPILDLTEHRRDVRWYVGRLEEVMIRTSADFGVRGGRVESLHGVWVETATGQEKLAALGVHLSRWVTSHGFAYNVATDLRFFELIVPCGIPDKRATSLDRLLGRDISPAEVRPQLASHFGDVFRLTMVPTSRQVLETALIAGTAAEVASPVFTANHTSRESAL